MNNAIDQSSRTTNAALLQRMTFSPSKGGIGSIFKKANHPQSQLPIKRKDAKLGKMKESPSMATPIMTFVAGPAAAVFP